MPISSAARSAKSARRTRPPKSSGPTWTSTGERSASGTGLAKVSVQTGSSHGGVVAPDGTVERVAIDFSGPPGDLQGRAGGVRAGGRRPARRVDAAAGILRPLSRPRLRRDPPRDRLPEHGLRSPRVSRCRSSARSSAGCSTTTPPSGRRARPRASSSTRPARRRSALSRSSLEPSRGHARGHPRHAREEVPIPLRDAAGDRNEDLVRRYVKPVSVRRRRPGGGASAADSSATTRREIDDGEEAREAEDDLPAPEGGFPTAGADDRRRQDEGGARSGGDGGPGGSDPQARSGGGPDQRARDGRVRLRQAHLPVGRVDGGHGASRPASIGHEFCGEIVAFGPGGKRPHLEEGQYVSAEMHVTCGALPAVPDRPAGTSARTRASSASTATAASRSTSSSRRSTSCRSTPR